MKFYGSSLLGPGGQPLPLSSAVQVGDLLHLSGQMALQGGKAPGDITEQTERVLDNIERILGEAGLHLGHVIKTTVWLTEAADFPAFNAVYSRRLAPPFPARSCVVSALLAPGGRVEIEAVAQISAPRA